MDWLEAITPDSAERWIALGTWVLAYLTWCLIVVAVGAGLVAFVQLREARALRRDENRAYVLVTPDVDVATRGLYIAVTNAGRTHASDVRISFEPPLESITEHGSDLGSSSLWNPELLAPGYSYRTVLDFSYERLDTDLPMRYDATVSYRSPATREQLTYTYPVDFSRFYAMREWTPVDRTREKSLEALKRVAKALEDISER